MLVPKNTRYRKAQKGGKKLTGVTKRGFELAFGSYGLKSLESGRLDPKQIEAARRVISRYVKRTGKLWIRVFPDVPVTKKPAEVRMGKGKGAVDHYTVKIKPGRIIFELEGLDDETASMALEKAMAKLPFKAKVIKIIY